MIVTIRVVWVIQVKLELGPLRLRNCWLAGVTQLQSTVGHLEKLMGLCFLLSVTGESKATQAKTNINLNRWLK